MARKGLQKVRTGCLTCKARKIKCDETRPECQRCKSTGRKCDGYRPPPPGSYSWDQLLHVRPRAALTATPGADTIELRGLAFFRQVVAPALGGSLESSFWTHLVAQVTYSEPAARHAVLAISSLYEKFSARPLELEFEPRDEGNDFAIKHYNSAIKHIVTPRVSDGSMDTVLLVCILFICIEFLRGNTRAAISHVSHGIMLLNSSKASSDLVSVFRHLSIFPYFFGGGVSTLPVLEHAESLPTYGSSFEELSRAKGSLDSLLSRSIRLVRTADHHRLGIGPELQPLEFAVWDQQRLDEDLDRWWCAFSIFREGFQPAHAHEATFLMLEVRWLVAKIWTNTCLSPDETVYDAHMDKFLRIVEIAQVAGTASMTQGPRFTFGMGFSPLLHFVVIKCRHLKPRLAALTLMKTLSCQRETLWDVVTMHAVGTRTIEIEHGIEITPDETETLQMVGESEMTLPEDRLRIRDNALGAALNVRICDDGTKVVRRRICFLVRSLSGGVEARHDWVTMKEPGTSVVEEMLHLFFLSLAASASAVVVQTPTPTPNLEARQTTTSPSDPTPKPTGDFTTTELIIIVGETKSDLTIPGQTITIAVPTCIHTITPDDNGYVPPGTCGAIWAYYPSFKAAAAFAALFVILVGIHIWQAAMYKKRWCWVIIMATIWEMAAMTFRAISSKNQQSEGIYLVFQIFILLAPLWVNAFAYMTLGRMIYYFHPSQSILHLPAAMIAAMFVFFDIASFIVQLVGGGMASPSASPETQQRAIHIYMGGIGFQEFMILVFVGLCIAFQVQMTTADGRRRGFWCSLFNTEWGQLLCTLYFSLAMITVRIIYRLVEFSGGVEKGNALTTHEAYFYILEAAPMFLALLSFNIVHPGRIMNGPGCDMPGLVATIKAKLSGRRRKQILLDDSSDEHELVPGMGAREHGLR